ncbi:hypothetical protein MS3_00001091 [Schistosoma haematobium]|uniref:DUF6451 domain-containing protein n=1 Tax=Schistosoma haematobium TaxID=6185 RepID=A0A922LMY4_SCHHA|nr:hypothetical protein MS3_00001091 [Schistosoma haematobium]KAH9590037.1 hypothetical protein MS3_00001091 [Schistosoma haematobium]
MRNSYDGLHCKVVHGGQLTDSFQVKIGVRQGCSLSLSLFSFHLVVDWIMKTSASQGKHGIQWRAWMWLHDLFFADDLALLSHTHQQMQMKTTSIAAASESLNLNIHKGKTKIPKYNTENTNLVTLDGALEEVKTFVLLGSFIGKQGGSDTEVNERTDETRAEFLQLKNICNSKQLAANNKVRIFNTNVKIVQLYGAETWRNTTAIINKVQVFVNNCLRKILNVRWPDAISNSHCVCVCV